MDMFQIDQLVLNFFIQLSDKFKTGNYIIDSIISTIIMGTTTFIAHKVINNISLDNFNIFKIIHYYIYKNNRVVLEGRRVLSTNNYWSSHSVPAYSDNFKAMWNHIIQNIDNNNDITNMREIICNYNKDYYDDNKNTDSETLFVVDQIKHFPIDIKNDIYAVCAIDVDQNNDEKNATKYEVIILEIYSSSKSMFYVKSFIENITKKYLQSIKDKRKNVQYIYTLVKNKFEETKDELWNECLFKSTRKFTNMFFDNKETILKKINFFINNKQWYIDNGIPYTLGIGLHGPPGTGKTSFIKSLANMFPERHLIILSFKIIKTKQQLDNFFFESKYNSSNKEYIDFSKKIIVFEDIDCETDILLKRSEEKSVTKNQETIIRELIKDNCEPTEKQSFSTSSSSNVTTYNDDKLTLDDILNLWDGIKETSGRIMVITSNHYSKLDPALTRPGRIDITLKLDLASHFVIKNMYYNFFKKNIPKNKIGLIKEYYFSPAQLTNYFYYSENKNDFLEKLIINSKN